MDLFTLRLNAPLSWNPVSGSPVDAAPDKEGSETVMIWNRDQLVTDNDDGPRLSHPLPPPLQTGISEVCGTASPLPDAIVLPAGSYLFCQGLFSEPDSIGHTLEWFFREVWWTRVEYRGPVYLRLIREDGKTAVQVIMESAKKD